MKNERLLLLILAIIQFTHILDFMIIMPLGSTLMHTFDISPQQFSLIVSAYAISAFISGIISAFFLDKFDRKSALIFAYIGFTIATFACAFSSGYVLFLVFRCLTGLFGGVLASLILSIVADTVPLNRRATAMSYIMMGFSTASVVGVPFGLYLSAIFTWQVPFLVVAGVSSLMVLFAFVKLPQMRKHLETADERPKAWANIVGIFRNKNQLRALGFTMLMMLGHFTIIPFIAPYMIRNVGFSDINVSYIYFIGGLATFFTLPLFGKLADKYGHRKIYVIMGTASIIPLILITNLPAVPFVAALMVTTLFFIIASGRSVPATTLVTSVVKSENRAGFMSLRSSANQLALALSSIIAGIIMVEDEATGALLNYNWVGYVAVFMTVLSVWMGSKLIAIDD
ncbi:MAG: DHA1 family inner membrane transport protein [Cognaticolwellia sp.]|jgi:predicted MFS family arabinose efflux permease